MRAAAGDPAKLLAELERRVEWLFSRPYLRRAHVFGRDEADMPRTFAAARDALAQLRALGGAAPSGPSASRRAARPAGRARRSGPARPRAGDRPARGARPPLRGALPARASGGRVPAARRAAIPSSPTTTGARSRTRRGSPCRCARTSSTASATCSTSARRARSGCWSCLRGRATRRAGRSSRRSSSRTCAQVLDLPERPHAVARPLGRRLGA